MSASFFYTILTLSSLGIVAAIILFIIAKKFKVEEDPRIDLVEELLPSANCGACGSPGCRHFAETCVNASVLTELFCPVGGNETMASIAKVLGQSVIEKDPMLAVVKCLGTPEKRPRINIYDGISNCLSASNNFIGDTACKYGCLGLGDCVRVCKFDAIYIDKTSGLPVVSEENCTGCGACIKVCPRHIIELRKMGPKGKRIFVSCVNKDKGAAAIKVCKTACIGCNKCVRECPFEAIAINDFLAYIDFEKCKLCRKCVIVCPTKVIFETNFPPRPAQKKQDEPNTNDKVTQPNINNEDVQ